MWQPIFWVLWSVRTRNQAKILSFSQFWGIAPRWNKTTPILGILYKYKNLILNCNHMWIYFFLILLIIWFLYIVWYLTNLFDFRYIPSLVGKLQPSKVSFKFTISVFLHKWTIPFLSHHLELCKASWYFSSLVPCTMHGCWSF